MTKLTTITCDECNADITKASQCIVSWKDSLIPMLDKTLHFCNYKHMYVYLDKKRPDDCK